MFDLAKDSPPCPRSHLPHPPKHLVCCQKCFGSMSGRKTTPPPKKIKPDETRGSSYSRSRWTSYRPTTRGRLCSKTPTSAGHLATQRVRGVGLSREVLLSSWPQYAQLDPPLLRRAWFGTCVCTRIRSCGQVDKARCCANEERAQAGRRKMSLGWKLSCFSGAVDPGTH